jgi:hypothetical protein
MGKISSNQVQNLNIVPTSTEGESLLQVLSLYRQIIHLTKRLPADRSTSALNEVENCSRLRVC